MDNSSWAENEGHKMPAGKAGGGRKIDRTTYPRIDAEHRQA
jgi:hypothetical protein